jgi:hypothetical protein
MPAGKNFCHRLKIPTEKDKWVLNKNGKAEELRAKSLPS